jgi:hypothetical protein
VLTPLALSTKRTPTRDQRKSSNQTWPTSAREGRDERRTCFNLIMLQYLYSPSLRVYLDTTSTSTVGRSCIYQASARVTLLNEISPARLCAELLILSLAIGHLTSFETLFEESFINPKVTFESKVSTS